MDLKQLECFVRVAELGSFTKAATALNISQPVLSRHVRQLEIELKKHLLYRNGRGVIPTESGRRLIAHGNGILHQVELARQELEDEEAFPVGKVVLGLPPSIGKLLTVRLVTAFRKLYPRASIRIVEGLSASMHEWLLLGRLDIALLYNPLPTPQLQYERVGSDALCLISSAGAKVPAKVRMAELGRFPIIIPSRPNSIRSLVEAECAKQGVTLNIALEIDAIASVLDLVEQDAGHAILTNGALHGRRGGNALRAARIVEPGITTHLEIATSAQRPLTKLAQRTVALIKTQLAAAGRFEKEAH